MVGPQRVKRCQIVLRRNGTGLDARFCGGTGDTQRDFTAVCDKQFLDPGLGMCHF